MGYLTQRLFDVFGFDGGDNLEAGSADVDKVAGNKQPGVLTAQSTERRAGPTLTHSVHVAAPRGPGTMNFRRALIHAAGLCGGTHNPRPLS